MAPNKLLESYLTNRDQIVIRKIKSDALIVKSGVPQSTILDPLLFITYSVMRKILVVSHADDTVILYYDDS